MLFFLVFVTIVIVVTCVLALVTNINIDQYTKVYFIVHCHSKI